MKRKNRPETVVEKTPVEVEPAPLAPEALALPDDSGAQRLIRIPPPPPPVQPLLAPPYIIGFLPFSGSPGTQVEISGAGFVAVQSVTFGGTPAAFSVVSEGRIFASVPFGAASGPIRVTNPAGTAAKENEFLWINDSPWRVRRQPPEKTLVCDSDICSGRARAGQANSRCKTQLAGSRIA